MTKPGKLLWITGYKALLCVCMVLVAPTTYAQMDVYTGTWQMEYQVSDTASISMELHVASPENNLLYPALLTINCGEFTASYTLLLVKKNIRQLSIGRHKIPLGESPISLGNWTVLLNGVFDLSKDNKGSQFLTVERLAARKYDVDMPLPKDFEPHSQGLANRLYLFLKEAEIRLKKTSEQPWQIDQPERILHSGSSPEYYGIIDSIFTKNREVSLEFPGSKKSGNGVVSVALNGRTIIDQADLGYKKPKEDILLDTGMNTVVFFTEAFGRTAASTGKLNLGLAKKNVPMDFATKENTAATFIVARIFYSREKEKNNTGNDSTSQLVNVNEVPSNTSNSLDGTQKNPDPKQSNIERALRENSLLRDAKVVGSVVVTSRQITLAIWDDAVEDGDSISLSLNGKWIRQGLAVKKQPQFITVTVDPGPNKITFIADNLGAIVPNTSVLEIYDGRERRSFMIDTNLRKNNLINIFYDNKP